MAGMIQIVTYLLCVYLVFKGVEILQIALMSPRENRTLGLLIGALSLVACCAAAAFFFVFITEQAKSISRATGTPDASPLVSAPAPGPGPAVKDDHAGKKAGIRVYRDKQGMLQIERAK